jgi:hypothetical protein
MTDEELLTELDTMVRAATRADGGAITAIALAFGLTLHTEAREELGPRFEQDAADVLQEFFLGLAEGDRYVMPRIRGAAIPWMKRTVREIARQFVAKQEPPGEAA